MFKDLKENIRQEHKILKDMNSIIISMPNDAEHRSFYLSSLASLSEQLRILNNAVPELLKEWSPVKGLVDVSEKDKKKNVASKVKETVVKDSDKKTVKMSYVSPSAKEKRYIVINKSDKSDFLKKLKVSESNLNSIQKIKKEQKSTVIKGPSLFARTSNKFFRGYGEKLSNSFTGLTSDLKKANIRFLTSTYLSMAILASVIALSIGFLLLGGLMFFNIDNWTYSWIPLALVLLVVTGFYLYPSNKAGSVQKSVSQELPFATIHMAAIAGSDIEPTKIFKIIAKSKEYPHIGAEIKKIITQIDIYGYDLVTSLKNVASRTSNKKLSELFSGLATNISTGGELKNYLEKKSENFLLDYRLERQKYSDLAGTFMDVYISILIAAPLVLMMMFIVMNVAGLGIGGLSINVLLALSIAGISIINIIFLFILHMKQPSV